MVTPENNVMPAPEVKLILKPKLQSLNKYEYENSIKPGNFDGFFNKNGVVGADRT